MTQKENVLYHLRSQKTITPLEALMLYGCFRLADVIFKLKKDGHNIVTHDETKEKKTYARYELLRQGDML